MTARAITSGDTPPSGCACHLPLQGRICHPAGPPSFTKNTIGSGTSTPDHSTSVVANAKIKSFAAVQDGRSADAKSLSFSRS